MKKYSKKLAPLFTNYLKKRTLKVNPDIGRYPDWDELVVNNIKVKMIHVGENAYGAFEDDEDIEGFPFKKYPIIQDVLKVLGSIFLIYFAYKISFSRN